MQTNCVVVVRWNGDNRNSVKTRKKHTKENLHMLWYQFDSLWQQKKSKKNIDDKQKLRRNQNWKNTQMERLMKNCVFYSMKKWSKFSFSFWFNEIDCVNKKPTTNIWETKEIEKNKLTFLCCFVVEFSTHVKFMSRKRARCVLKRKEMKKNENALTWEKTSKTAFSVLFCMLFFRLDRFLNGCKV